MSVYDHFIRAINKQAQKTTIEMTPISMEENMSEKHTCKEIEGASTMNEAISIAKTCMAGMGGISTVSVIGIIVTRLADLAMITIRGASMATDWKSWFELLCWFLRDIMNALASIGVLNQGIANDTLVSTIVDVVISKLGSWLVMGPFGSANEAILNSPQMKQFIKDLIAGGPKNIEIFCRQIAQWTEEELVALVGTISSEAQKIGSLVNIARQYLQAGLASPSTRAILILALLAALGITASTGGFSAPVTAPIAALIILIFVMTGQSPPTMEEIQGAWKSA